MKRAISTWISLWIVAYVLSGCSHDRYTVGKDYKDSMIKVKKVQTVSKDAFIPIMVFDQQKYISIQRMVSILDFQSKWDAATKTYRFGDRDVEYELTLYSKKAMKEGKTVLLSNVPIMENAAMYLPLSSVSTLFANEINFEITPERIIVHPFYATNFINPHKENYFQEDPDDPFRDMLESTISESTRKQMRRKQQNRMDMNQLVARAERYVGVQYKFAAERYPTSGKFDASSFTQYIFNQSGKQLPRSVIEQAEVGKEVSSRSLRKGDLLFFANPGLYKSSKKASQVAIYIGNMKMIFAGLYEKNAVQIAKLDTPYWQDRFLFARRIK